MSAEDRIEVIEEARGYVTKDRNTSYGEPEDNFKAIADIWTAQGITVDGRALQSHDVALMMLGMKLARLRYNPTHRDSWVDAIGYAACGWDTAKRVSDEPVSPAIVSVSLHGISPAALDAAFNGNGRRGCGDWVSHNNCGMTNPQPHAAHSYSSGSRGFDSLHGAYWCDGYVDGPEPDVEVVKRVADKYVRDSERKCQGKEPHHDCSPKKASEPGA